MKKNLLMNKRLLIIILSFLIVIGAQCWFFYLSLRYPYLGIQVKQNETNEWVIDKIDTISGAQLFFQKDDIVKKIDGINPDDYFTVKKWRAIEQADTIEVIRNENYLKISTNQIKNNSNLDVQSVVAEIVCLFFAALLYVKISTSNSGRLLSLLFVTIGLTFMGFGASIRGDALGKIFITTFLITIPIVFLHFLIVFLKEKGNFHLPLKFLKILYLIPFANFIFRLGYFIDSISSYNYAYKNNSNIILLIFVLGNLLNIFILFYVYFKHRGQQSYLSTIIKVVFFALIVSFLPITVFSLIPALIYGHEWINSLYTAWFVLIFPLTFAYLIAAKKLYDIDIVVRRMAFTTIVAVLPSALIVIAIVLLFEGDATFLQAGYAFIVTLVVMSSVLYSLEYFYTNLERVMFPRKYMLQAALKKIAKNLGSITSFRELKTIILVDIVNTLQVFGGAIAFKYKDATEIISEGAIDEAEVERIVTADPAGEHPEYMCFEINRHDEYTSYLVMANKKTNTKLGMEEIQWLNLIITYLAVSLENVHLIRKLTMRLEQLAANLPNEQDARN